MRQAAPDQDVSRETPFFDGVALFHVNHLPIQEFAEDHVEQILDINPAGDATKRRTGHCDLPLSDPQILWSFTIAARWPKYIPLMNRCGGHGWGSPANEQVPFPEPTSDRLPKLVKPAPVSTEILTSYSRRNGRQIRFRTNTERGRGRGAVIRRGRRVFNVDHEIGGFHCRARRRMPSRSTTSSVSRKPAVS